MRFPRTLHANLSTIGKASQLQLSRASVSLCGLGGVGGIAFELLVRAGIGSVRISDPGFFEESNANRQSLWSRENDGRKKCGVAKEFAASVNPDCKISIFPGVKTANAAKFAVRATAVIDSTDTLASRRAVYAGCQKSGVPYVFASARGTRGMLTVFHGTALRKKPAFLSSLLASHKKCDHALGTVSNAIGCLAAQQALNLALAKPTITYPKALSYDAFSNEPLVLHSF